MKYTGKRALVCGMAKSGIAAAALLQKLGAVVTLQDMKERDAVPAAALELEKEGVTLYTGKNPDDIACEQDLIVLSPAPVSPAICLLLKRQKRQVWKLSAKWNWLIEKPLAPSQPSQAPMGKPQPQPSQGKL